MDTNMLSMLITELMNEKLRQPAVPSSALIIILAAVAPTLVSLAAYLNAKATKISSAENAVGIEKIHVAVNSERTAMLELVARLRDDILKLSQEKSELQENKRGQETAASVAAASKGSTVQ